MKFFAFKAKPLIAAILGTMLSASAHATVREQDNTTATPRREAENLTQIIVKYRNERSNANEAASLSGNKAALAQVQTQRISALQSVARTYNATFTLKRQIVTGGWVYRANTALKPSQMMALAAKLQAADRSIEYAEPDYILRPAYTPTDPLFTSQWDMQESATQPGGLNLSAAWDISKGDKVTVAVIDTGYRPHPDLLQNLIPAPGGSANQYGYNFISKASTARITLPKDVSSARGPDAIDLGDWVEKTDTDCPSHTQDSSWHGTHVAGTIAAAANGIGITGVAPNARILPLRALGKCGGESSDIADAVAWAAGLHIEGVPDNTNKANVINLSLGGTHACSKTNAAAYQSAIANGSVIVVAAGNEALDARLSSPANCPGVITVASNSITGGRASYSNYGATVSVTAPGGGFTTAADRILSTLPSGKTIATDDTTYGLMAGTSQATPHVAGVIALMMAVNPKLTSAQVRSILIKTARPAPANCPGCGAGIVDAAAAVKAASGN